MEPSKAAIAAFQFVDADIARSDAMKALRDAPECILLTDPMFRDRPEPRRCAGSSPCSACKVRDRLHAELKRAAKVRKFARLRAIRAVRKEATR